MSVKITTAMINGIMYTLEMGEDGYYHAIVPAPKSQATDLVEFHGYPVYIQSEDQAGNVSSREDHLVVKEDIFIRVKHWESRDYFNAIDYNRIKYNIGYIKQIADMIYDSVEYENPGPDKSWEEYPEPEDFRQMERNLNYICHAADLDPEQYRIHQSNKPFMGAEDFNRIEEACWNLFRYLYGVLKSRRRLPSKLGKRGIL